MRNKKGISTMIEYVMLITIAISLSGVVYIWLKGYTPAKEEVSCPNGVSLYFSKIDCKQAGDYYSLNITLKNTGRFSLRGFFVRGATDVSELASIDISEEFKFNFSEGEVLFGDVAKTFGNNSFIPGEEMTFEKIVISKDIKKIDIIPTRAEDIGKTRYVAICSNSLVSERIICGS